MVTVSESTLRANVYETIYDLLSAGVSSTSFPVSGVTLSAAYIDESQKIPQVVINPADVEYTEFSFGRNVGKKEIRVLIDIYTKKNKDKDQIADYIANSLTTNAFVGFYLANLSDSNAFETPGMGSKIHLKSLACTFVRR
jgi:hypothetical protein